MPEGQGCLPRKISDGKADKTKITGYELKHSPISMFKRPLHQSWFALSPFNTREMLTFLICLTRWTSPKLPGKVEPISPYICTETKWSLRQITAPAGVSFIVWHHLLSQTNIHTQNFILMMDSFVTWSISSLSLSNLICPPTASLSSAQSIVHSRHFWWTSLLPGFWWRICFLIFHS